MEIKIEVEPCCLGAKPLTETTSMSSAPLTMEKLEEMREKHVTAKNMEYNAVMKEIFDEGIAKLNIEEIKREIMKKSLQSPRDSSVEIRVKIDMDKAFREEKCLKDFLGKPILTNAGTQPLECWFDAPAPRDAYGNVCGSSEYSMCYILQKRNHEVNSKLWQVWFFANDPNVQRLRTFLKKEFPEAELHPSLFVQILHPAYLDISISYKLPSKIQGSQKNEAIIKKDAWGCYIW